MDQILGIVCHDDFEANLVMLLIEQHPLKHPVQAVGFGSGTVVRADSEVHVGKTRLQFADRAQRGIVIRIGANEEVVIVVIDRGDVVFHHPGDHLILVPQRHKHRNVFLNVRFGRFRPRRSAHPGPQANGIQSQVV